MLVGIDVGGTFTDIASFDPARARVAFGKVLTTHGNISAGVLSSFDSIGASPGEVDSLKHGTTVVINALLKRSGARTALVTTRGFRDILQIARGNRPVMFDLFYRRNPPLVPRNLRYEISERMSADGTVLQPLATEEIEGIAEAIRRAGCRAVAVAFVNSYANPAHEDRVARELMAILPDLYVCTSTSISRQWYEYERTATASRTPMSVRQCQITSACCAGNCAPRMLAPRPI